MANVSAPFGFVPYRGNGASPTYELSTRQILSTDTNQIFRGDLVLVVTTGYVAIYTVGSTVRVEGVFWGCKYTSTSQKRTVWSSYWPGADAVAGSVEAYIYSGPQMQFEVQATGTNGVYFANIGEYIDILNGGGNTATGISGMSVASGTLATTVTLPLIVVGLISDPPGSAGADSVSPFNRVIVGFNNQSGRTNGAGPTGIA
jgi:hypothetical protein